MKLPNLLINTVLCAALFIPVGLLISGLIAEKEKLVLISLMSTLGFAIVGAGIAANKILTEKMLGVSVENSKEIAINKLADVELGWIWVFPRNYTWKISEDQWIEGTRLHGVTLGAAFFATSSFPYLMVGFFVLASLCIGLTGEFGPTFKLLAFANARIQVQIAATLISTWAATDMLFLGATRIFVKIFNGRAT